LSPKKHPTRAAERSTATARLKVARKYLEAAELFALDADPYATNVAVGVAVLAGLAASDAI